MGVAKSLRKADYLSKLGKGLDDLRTTLEANRKKEEQKQLYNTIVGYWDKYQQGLEAAKQKGTILKDGGKVPNVFSPESLSPYQKSNILGTDKKPEMGLNVNIPSSVNQDMIPKPLPPIPETQTHQTTPQEQYEKGNTAYDEFANSVIPLLLKSGIDPTQASQINVLSTLAKQQTESLKPKEPTFYNLSQGEERRKYDSTTGKDEQVALNPKIQTEKPDKKDFKVSARGKFMYWDDTKNDFVETNWDAPKEKGDQSSAWARLFYEMTKDKEKGAETKKQNQEKYNAIMGSPFKSIEELKAQGITIPEGSEKKGGAYVVRDDKNYQNYKIFYTDEELKNYAENQVTEAPNKWKRPEKNANDPLGIR